MRFLRHIAWFLAMGCSLLAIGSIVSGAEPRPLISPSSADGMFEGWGWFSEKPDTPVDKVWTISDEGILICQGTPRGYLYTTTPYTHFRLSLEWRWPPGQEPGKGGVLVRMTGPNKIWPRSLELQMNTGHAGDLIGLDGYSLAGPNERRSVLDHEQYGRLTFVKKKADVERPAGQWNRYEIVVDGDAATAVLNGQTVNRATGCEVVAGKICLTAEGNGIEFRNVYLTPLNPD